ncbi:hypothetical protein N7523_001628 [Penicillium sp. IBT 18751x]|nr:hypothetical protein N7523_001628 [Penicillium sp. IBT 18751x]
MAMGARAEDLLGFSTSLVRNLSSKFSREQAVLEVVPFSFIIRALRFLAELYSEADESPPGECAQSDTYSC